MVNFLCENWVFLNRVFLIEIRTNPQNEWVGGVKNVVQLVVSLDNGGWGWVLRFREIGKYFVRVCIF